MPSKALYICKTCKYNKDQDKVPADFTFDTRSDFEFHFYAYADMHKNKKSPDDALEVRESKKVPMKTSITESNSPDNSDNDEEKSTSTDTKTPTQAGDQTPMMTPKRKKGKDMTKALSMVNALLNEPDDDEKENEVDIDYDESNLMVDLSPTTDAESVQLSDDEQEPTVVTLTKFLKDITMIDKVITVEQLCHKRPKHDDFRTMLWYLKDSYWSTRHFEDILKKSISTDQWFLNLKNYSQKLLGDDYNQLRISLDHNNSSVVT